MTVLLLDQMHKRLTKWCRIFGISSEFFSGSSDSQLLEIAKRRNQIIVTRDLELIKRCRKHGVRCIQVVGETLEEQLAQVIRESGEKPTFPEKTRCPECNGELKMVSKEEAKVPEKAAEFSTRFWKCSSCAKTYWDGSHWNNIERIYKKTMELLA